MTPDNEFGWWLRPDLMSHGENPTISSSTERVMPQSSQSQGSRSHSISIPSSKNPSTCESARESISSSKNPASRQNSIEENAELEAFYENRELGEITNNFRDIYHERCRVKSGMCYTPERLVKADNYRILTPEPRSNPHVFEDLKNSPFRVLLSMRCNDQKSESEDSSQDRCGCDCTTKRSSIQSNEISSKYFNSCHYCPCLGKDFCPLQSNMHCIRSKNCSFSSEPQRTCKTHKDQEWDQRDIFFDVNPFCDICCSHQCLKKFELRISSTENILSANNPEPEMSLEQIRWNVENKQDSNRSISEEIFALKKDFMVDEWKVDNLLEVAKTLRKEIHEMKYLDDLIRLLEGKLEKISPTNWPFAIKNINCNREEIHLIV